MTPILQSAPWAQFQLSLGKTVFEQSGDGWSFLAIAEKTPLGSFLYVPYGPSADSRPALARALAALKSLAANVGAQYVRIEPIDSVPADDAVRVLTGLGLRKAPTDLQPKLTWKLDLTQSRDQLLAAMRSSNRNIFRNIHKKGVSFEVSTNPGDISILLGFLHNVSSRAEFKAQSDAYLRTAAETLMPAGAAKLFIARLDGKPIAAALSYDTGQTRVYAHAAADDSHRKLSAGIALVVTMVLDAKDSGMADFDMWGVSPAGDTAHAWAGFSAFKRSFGGYEVAYPGSWDLPVNRPMYAAYSGIRALRTMARKSLRRALKR